MGKAIKGTITATKKGKGAVAVALKTISCRALQERGRPSSIDESRRGGDRSDRGLQKRRSKLSSLFLASEKKATLRGKGEVA